MVRSFSKDETYILILGEVGGRTNRTTTVITVTGRYGIKLKEIRETGGVSSTVVQDWLKKETLHRT